MRLLHLLEQGDLGLKLVHELEVFGCLCRWEVGTHSVSAGVMTLLGSARLGIVVFFDDDVHVHFCHHLAHARHGYATNATMGHLDSIVFVLEVKPVGRGYPVWLMVND